MNRKERRGNGSTLFVKYQQEIDKNKKLIQEYKALTRENKFLQDENNIYKNETISKNIIRAKIEELTKEYLVTTDLNRKFDEISPQIKILKKILGDENND